ncbi:hypothetical protein FGRMN_6468 [Fusarium graminum]|nr:hypothetical protein FGRMN_6468 [Fusarium graminum]
MPSFTNFIFALLSISSCSVLGAHVQFRSCSTATSSLYRFEPTSLRAFLDKQETETDLRLRILAEYPTNAACHKSLLENASVELSLAALGGTSRYNGEIRNATCQTYEYKQINKVVHSQILNVLFTVENPSPLAAYELEVVIDAPDHFSVACMDAFLTPDIGSIFQHISFWGPIITFALVLVAAGWREWYNLVHASRDDDESGQERVPNRSHLTRIADCLAYIQFIFFTSALSLNQPGFLQPVTSSLSWSTLMLRRGIVWRKSRYYGIHDGIHEINGTFGGTSGLEHMTQVMAAPLTVDTWTNIATLALAIFAFLFMMLQVGLHVRWTRDWFKQLGSWILESPSKQRHKATVWVALRVFLSYLLLPLTAWTTYQLDSASARSIYYTLLVVVVVALLLIGSWWGMSSRSPQNMGYLLVDDLHMQDPDEEPSRTQDYYTFVTFILLFARGVIIGGLQRFGVAQLFSLMACEVVQLSFLAYARVAPGFLSKPVLVAGARLCGLLLCLGMTPYLWNHTAASALGYVFLVFNALFLIGMFFVPSTFELWGLIVTSFRDRRTAPARPSDELSSDQPQVFGLRQLARRPTTKTNLSGRRMLDHDRNSSLSSSANSADSSLDSPTASSRNSGPASPEILRTYFRSPRHERSVSSMAGSSRQFSSFETTRPERCVSSLSERSYQFPSFERTRPPPTVYEDPNQRRSEGSSRSSDSGELVAPQSPWEMVLPSNPNVDYSVRETDLYYVKPRRVSFGHAENSSDSSGRQSASWVGKLKFWS